MTRDEFFKDIDSIQFFGHIWNALALDTKSGSVLSYYMCCEGPCDHSIKTICFYRRIGRKKYLEVRNGLENLNYIKVVKENNKNVVYVNHSLIGDLYSKFMVWYKAIDENENKSLKINKL